MSLPAAQPLPSDRCSAADWPAGRVLVIAATYNERENLSRLIEGVLAAEPALQLLIVDDNSPDDTGTVALAAAAADPRVHALVRRGRRGLGSAIMEGLRLAKDHSFDVAINIDADLSHASDDIPRLLAALDPVGGPPADVVVGSRRVPGGRTVGWPMSRHVTSRLVAMFARRILGVPVRDPSSGYRAIRLSLLDHLGTPATTGYAFHEELLWLAHRAGARIVEIPMTFRDRTHGSSKAGLREILEASRDLLVLARKTWLGGTCCR
jgi:dolichol-phosphate mannosyltransferase